MFSRNLAYSMQWGYNLYSQQKEISLGVDKMEALPLLGIMLLSGYSRSPYSRLYWSEYNIHNSLVSDSLRQNRFDVIIRDLYFRDNTNLLGDR